VSRDAPRGTTHVGAALLPAHCRRIRDRLFLRVFPRVTQMPAPVRRSLSVPAAILLLAGLVVPGTQAKTLGAPTAIYVSPITGSDSNPGTESQPLQTLPAAQQLVRSENANMTGPLTVYLEDGTYRLTHPLTFTPLDSGTNGYTVSWTAAPGASPIISGAIQISAWKLANASKQIWSAPVPASLSTRQIYVNGMRASMTMGFPPTPLTRAGIAYIASSSAMEHWRNPSGIEFAYPNQLSYPAWPICPASKIQGKFIYMAQPCWNNSNDRKPNLVGWSGGFLTQPSYIENAYELLAQPGQFYLDQHKHVLYYIPRAGEDMSTADVEAPVLQTLISGSGTPQAPIHDVTFSGIEFAFATWMQPSTPEGFSEIQSNYTVTGKRGYAYQGLCHLEKGATCPYGNWTKEPGNVAFSYDQHIHFLDDRFVHLGGAGLNLDDGSQNGTVKGCVFTDISGNGIEIGGVDMPEAKGSAQTDSMTVADNHIYGIGVEYPGAAGILAGYVADTSIAHNQIDHVPYVAISVGWGGWLDKRNQPSVPNYAHDDSVTNNLIYDFMEVVADGGGIYTQGILGTSLKTGLQVTGNVVHDQLDWGGALKGDDGTTYVTYQKNVLYNNIYDWSALHDDFRKNATTHYDPVVVENNWWQQGDANTYNRGIVEQNNSIIAGPADAPGNVLSNAGVEPGYASLLSWVPDTNEVPNPPQSVFVMYAFEDRAYVIWHQSYAYGSSPVTSYTITPCSIVKAQPGLCRPTAAPVTVPASQVDTPGYTIVSGLKTHAHYRFIITAQNAAGTSTPSLPSKEITVGASAPPSPTRPTNVWYQLGVHAVTIGWYRPGNDKGVRLMATRDKKRGPLVLGYVVTSSTGHTYSVANLASMIATNTGSKNQLAITGLSAKRFRFSIQAVTPTGLGPAARTGWLTPYS
jgi:hypothetical protein